MVLRILNPDSTIALLAVPINGGERRELYRSKRNISVRIWTMDSRNILVVDRDGNTGVDTLLSIPVTGGEPATLGLAMQTLGGMEFHPNGRRLAFVGRHSQTELWVIRNLLVPAKGAR